MKKESLRRDLVYGGLTNLSDFIFFFLIIVAGRVLGVESFGAFSFAQSLAFMVISISNFGLNTLASRDVSRDHSLAPRYLGNLITWKIILSVAAFICLILISFFITKSNRELIGVISIMGLTVIMRFFSMMGRHFFHAFKRFDSEAVVVCSEQIFLFVVGVIFLLNGFGIYGLAIAFLLSRTLGCLVTYWWLVRQINFSLKFEPRFIWNLQIKALPLGSAFFLMTAYMHINTLIVSSLLSYNEVGLYNAAYKIYSGLFLFPSVVSTVLFPRLTKSFKENKEAHDVFLVKGILGLAVIASPIAIGGMFFSKPIISLVFGVEFIQAGTTLAIFSVVTLIAFQVWFLRTILVAIDRQKALVAFNLLGLLMLILFDFILIPKFEIVGVAIAIGGSQLIVFLGIWIFLFKNHFRLKNLNEITLKILSGINPTRGY